MPMPPRRAQPSPASMSGAATPTRNAAAVSAVPASPAAAVATSSSPAAPATALSVSSFPASRASESELRSKLAKLLALSQRDKGLIAQLSRKLEEASREREQEAAENAGAGAAADAAAAAAAASVAHQQSLESWIAQLQQSQQDCAALRQSLATRTMERDESLLKLESLTPLHRELVSLRLQLVHASKQRRELVAEAAAQSKERFVAHAQESDAWAAERTALQAQIAELKQQNAALPLPADLDRLRTELHAEFEARAQAWEAELAATNLRAARDIERLQAALGASSHALAEASHAAKTSSDAAQIALTAAHAEAQAEKADRRRALADLDATRADLEATRAQLAQAQAEWDDRRRALAELDAARSELETTRAQLAKAQEQSARLDAAHQELDVLRSNVATLRAQLDAAQRDVSAAHQRLLDTSQTAEQEVQRLQSALESRGLEASATEATLQRSLDRSQADLARCTAALSAQNDRVLALEGEAVGAAATARRVAVLTKQNESLTAQLDYAFQSLQKSRRSQESLAAQQAALDVALGSLAQFEESLEAPLSCTACTNLFQDPLGLPCGHTFCRGCVETNPGQTNVVCTECSAAKGGGSSGGSKSVSFPLSSVVPALNLSIVQGKLLFLKQLLAGLKADKRKQAKRAASAARTSAAASSKTAPAAGSSSTAAAPTAVS